MLVFRFYVFWSLHRAGLTNRLPIVSRTINQHHYALQYQRMANWRWTKGKRRNINLLRRQYARSAFDGRRIASDSAGHSSVRTSVLICINHAGRASYTSEGVRHHPSKCCRRSDRAALQVCAHIT